MQKSFNQQLRELSPTQQLIYITALAQRSSINYTLFCDAVGFLGAEELNNLLNLLWESLLNKGSKINWPVQLEKLPELQPDPEEFEIYGVLPALDATLGLELAIEQALAPDSENIIKASRLSRSTVSKFLVRQLPEDFTQEHESAWVQTQPLMQDEQDFQDELLLQVSNYTPKQQESIRNLRQLAYNHGFSNLGIALN